MTKVVKVNYSAVKNYISDALDYFVSNDVESVEKDAFDLLFEKMLTELFNQAYLKSL